MESGGVQPSGTVTFLFTDIEGSTKRWEADPDVMRVELAAHDDVLRAAVETEGGWLFKHTGDGVCAAFQSAQAAVDAAVVAQRVLGLPVRMGIASGEAELRGDDYFGPTLNTAARVMDAGHGGQVLVAGSTASLVSDIELIDLGLRSLRDLSAPVQLFQVRADGLATEFPPLRTVDVVQGNMPVLSTSFVGRKGAVDTLNDAFASYRVVTLTGVGGVGKTRLALQTAAVLAPRFRDGAWLVEFATIADGSGVDAAIASVFMLQPQPGRSWRQIVVESLHDREVLLVLDNCEHVLDGVVDLVEAIVATCESTSVLVTSRESLGVRAEWAWRVPSLEPSSSVELFIERADAGASGFHPDEADLVIIAELCDRLDGIPLAIELAAARVLTMSPAQIRERLDERFRFLTGSRRSIDRHQTLRHAMQWSYDLLDATEQAVLHQVSVFVGGFTLDAATAVTDLDEFELLDHVDSLVRKSLIHVDRSDTAVRYGMLETIRQFAEEALAATGDSDAARQRHATFFANQAEAAYQQLQTDDERLAYRWVDTEITNVAAAFHWALARHDADSAVRIAANTHRIARNRLRTETFGWPEAAIDLAREYSCRQFPHLLSEACDAAFGESRFEDSVRCGREAIALNEDNTYDFAVRAYWLTGFALAMLGDVDEALSVVRVGAQHPADHPVRGNLAYLHILAFLCGVGRPESEVLEAITQVKASPMPTIRAGGMWVQALLTARSDVTAAINLCQDAIDATVDCGNRVLEETCRGFQLRLLARTDDLDSALTVLSGVVDSWQVMADAHTARGRHMMDMRSVTYRMRELVALLARLGYHDGATRLWGALTRGQSLADTPHTVSALPDSMGTQAFMLTFNAGAALDPRSVGELAHELISQVRRDHLGA